MNMMTKICVVGSELEPSVCVHLQDKFIITYSIISDQLGDNTFSYNTEVY